MIEVGIDQLQLSHLEAHRLHESGKLVYGAQGGAVTESGPDRFPIGIPEQVAGAFEKLLAFEPKVHDPVGLLGVPAGKELDFIAAAAMQHARRNGEGTILAIDAGESLVGGKAHLLQAGLGIKYKDLQTNALEGGAELLPLGESECAINAGVMVRKGIPSLGD